MTRRIGMLAAVVLVLAALLVVDTSGGGGWRGDARPDHRLLRRLDAYGARRSATSRR